MSHMTITHPTDSTKSYTFGSKGARPEWVTAGLANGTIKLPEGYVSAKDKAAALSQARKAEKDKANTVADLQTKLDRLVRAAAHLANKHSVAVRHLDEAKVALDAGNKAVEDAKAALEAAKTGTPAAPAQDATTDKPATEVAVTPVEAPVAETATAG